MLPLFEMMKMMKTSKYFLALAALGIVTLGTLSSCKEKLKKVEGVVKSVDATKHSHDLKTMKIYDGQDTLLFSLKDAQYSNGLMLNGDSVQVHYIKGHGDTLRALLVYVKPAPAKVIDLKKDTTKVLLTK